MHAALLEASALVALLMASASAVPPAASTHAALPEASALVALPQTADVAIAELAPTPDVEAVSTVAAAGASAGLSEAGNQQEVVPSVVSALARPAHVNIFGTQHAPQQAQSRSAQEKLQVI